MVASIVNNLRGGSMKLLYSMYYMILLLAILVLVRQNPNTVAGFLIMSAMVILTIFVCISLFIHHTNRQLDERTKG